MDEKWILIFKIDGQDERRISFNSEDRIRRVADGLGLLGEAAGWNVFEYVRCEPELKW